MFRQHPRKGASVVTLTRLTGSVFALNSDLIESVDSASDTVITLIDGSRYVVRESLDEVVERVRLYRGGVIAAASQLNLAGEEPPLGSAQVAPLEQHALVVPFRTREP